MFGEGIDTDDLGITFATLTCNNCLPQNTFNQFQWYDSGTAILPVEEQESEDYVLSLEETIKTFLTELLYADELNADDVERLSVMKELFELQEEERKVTAKRLKLAETILKRRL